ncbi:hypothetical protein SAMN04487970_100739 [Paenibacillus tianmuensis]|uniref:Uncharacterized protein n=1 Tax=Paenibacillus tianmuensis TaxID=624147 RepID=A0A1G4QHB2_9BACL|nr:hypothetical protein [Paenibacillus tianmuensis]SCW43845.1 hypothetical protein SAMN04487970_100739 [Paenibacillus tianmuensis]
MDGYKHYVRIDVAGIVTHGFSSAFETPESSDICIDEHAGRHFTLQLRNESLQYKYQWQNGALAERSQVELDAEWAGRPVAQTTPEEKLAALTAQLKKQEEQAAAVSADLQAFMEYFMSKGD